MIPEDVVAAAGPNDPERLFACEVRCGSIALSFTMSALRLFIPQLQT